MWRCANTHIPMSGFLGSFLNFYDLGLIMCIYASCRYIRIELAYINTYIYIYIYIYIADSGLCWGGYFRMEWIEFCKELLFEWRCGENVTKLFQTK